MYMLVFPQECLIVYSRLLLEVHAIFYQECLIVFSRLLLEVHAMFSPVMYYSLFEIAVRRSCYFFIRNVL